MAARRLLRLAIILSALPTSSADAQTRKPTAQEVAAIRNCATKYQDDVDEGERQCLFNLVATPCTNTREGSSNLGTADCYRVEWVIWDNLLNENFKNLMGALDNQQTAKLRAMQQAWIAYRDTTCNFYMDKIQGSMAIPMGAACAARETARRALLLRFFDQSRLLTARDSAVQASRRSYSSTALSRTCAPAAHCSKLVHSASLCEIPPRLGTKIMVVGATRAM
jgi:uncharacterized protein YecT (DUF1311 family)